MALYTDLHVKVKASSSSNSISITPQGWKLKVKAPPVEGKANKEIIRFISKLIKIPKRDIVIKSGDNSPYKVIRISGLEKEDLEQRLSNQ